MRILVVLIYVLTTCSMLGAITPEQLDGWPFKTFNGEELPALQTPRFDFANGAIFFNTNVTNEIHKRHLNGNVFPDWPVTEPENIFNNSPLICDIDHAGKDEVVIVGSFNSLFLVDDDASVFPGFPITIPDIAPPNVADFDGDGEYELVFFSITTNLIYCVDTDGNSEEGWPITRPDDAWGSIGGGGAVGDLYLDGFPDYVLLGRKNIYAYRFNGQPLEHYPIHIFDDDMNFNYWIGPSLADIDNDGYLEILVNGDDNQVGQITGFVTVYEHSGLMKSGWPRFMNRKRPLACPTVGDLDNDGTMELCFGGGGIIYVLDTLGNDLPGWPRTFLDPASGNAATAHSDIIIADLNGDGYRELLWDNNTFHQDSTGYFGYLYGADYTGQSLPGFPFRIRGDLFWRPPTLEYDSVEHKIYMGLYSEVLLPWDNIDTAYVELFRFPDSTGPLDQWPMQSHDNLQTKNFNFVDMARTSLHDKPLLPGNFVLRQNYPNPFNSSTAIEFAIPRNSPVELCVYGLLGREVARPVCGILPAGTHTVAVDLDNQSSGVYSYSLRSAEVKIRRRMILLK